jgi:hypothetical protein
MREAERRGGENHEGEQCAAAEEQRAIVTARQGGTIAQSPAPALAHCRARAAQAFSYHEGEPLAALVTRRGRERSGPLG